MRLAPTPRPLTRALPVRAWAALALSLALLACGRSPTPGSVDGSGRGGDLQAPAPAQVATGTLKVRVVYDYVGDRENTPWASYEKNGAYNYPEPIVGGWPVRVVPLGATPGSPFVVETKQELSPTDGRYLELPVGTYRLEQLQPQGGPDNSPGVPYWVNTGANQTAGGSTTSSPAGTTSLEVEVVAGTDHATATVARFFSVCETYFYNTPDPVKTFVTYEPSQFPSSFPEDVKAGGNDESYTCRPVFGAGSRPLTRRVVSAGQAHSLAVKADGTVAAWGFNGFGQTSVPPGLSDVAAVAAGGFYSMALKADGSVVAWGENCCGQRDVPPGLSDVVAVSAGQVHALALKGDGTVVAWGNNDAGQTNVPPGLAGVTAVAAGGFYSMALKNDGTVVTWGLRCCAVPSGLSGLAAVSAGQSHALALKGDGTVTGWGRNDHGQASPPTGLSDVAAVSAGFRHSLALKADGTVVAWGDNGGGQTNVPAGLSGVVAVAAGPGAYHSLAVKADGSVVAWGLDDQGQTDVPPGLVAMVP